MLGNQLLELAGELRVTAERELRLDPLLERSESDLLQSRNRNLGERFIGKIGKRRSTPKRKRLPQQLRCGLCVAALERLPPFFSQAGGGPRFESARGLQEFLLISSFRRLARRQGRGAASTERPRGAAAGALESSKPSS